VKKHWNKKDVVYTQAKKIRVTAESTDIKTEIDGDPGPSLPVDIEVVPKAVKVLTPENAKPAGLRTRVIRALK
jgi:diacylglycerol kinase family enzyme